MMLPELAAPASLSFHSRQWPRQHGSFSKLLAACLLRLVRPAWNPFPAYSLGLAQGSRDEIPAT